MLWLSPLLQWEFLFFPESLTFLATYFLLCISPDSAVCSLLFGVWIIHFIWTYSLSLDLYYFLFQFLWFSAPTRYISKTIFILANTGPLLLYFPHFSRIKWDPVYICPSTVSLFSPCCHAIFLLHLSTCTLILTFHHSLHFFYLTSYIIITLHSSQRMFVHFLCFCFFF